MLAIIILLVAMLGACRGRGAGNPGPAPANTTIIQPNVSVLADSTISTSTSTVISDGGVLTLNTTTLSAQISAGDVIVSDQSTTFPDGILAKVTSVTQSGNQVIVTTAPATLEDVIQDADIQLSKSLTTADVAAAKPLLKGVSLKKSDTVQAVNAGTFSISLNDVVLYDADGDAGTTTDQIVANGSIALEPILDFSLSIQNAQMKKLSFSLNATETAHLSVQTQVTLSIQKSKEIAKYRFSPITVWVGVVPIVITPVLTVNVGISGSISYGTYADVTQDATLTAGLSYDNGAWAPISTFTNNFQFNQPAGSLAAAAKVEAGPQLDLLIYGVAGPYANVNAFLQLDITPAADPLSMLYGGLSGAVGVKLKVLSSVVADYNQTVIDYKKLLWQYNVGSIATTW